ncbi:MAG: PAS domain-containing protein [Paracoccaceae bacterium]
MTLPIDAAIDQTIEPDAREEAKRSSSVLCSAAPGTPVVAVSDSFGAHTGYKPSEAIGRNLSFLQGPNTESEAVEKFRTLIANGEAGLVRITNYRADGSEFIHECDFRPVRDEQETITHFVTIQRLL